MASKNKDSSTKSMTGFGKSQTETATALIEIEIKSVNHRFLDISFRLPRVYNPFENSLRKLISSKLERGKLDVYISRQTLPSADKAIDFNAELFEAYLGIYKDVFGKHANWNEQAKQLVALELMKVRDILKIEDSEDRIDQEQEALSQVLQTALSSLCAMREEEGAALRIDIEDRLAHLEKLRIAVAKATQTSASDKSKLLSERLELLSPEVVQDPARLAIEVAVLADKIDVSEEITRLESHSEQFKGALSSYPQGRKLDFILQEMFREWNTITSKCQNAEVQTIVIEAKVELEKMREQVQNVE